MSTFRSPAATFARSKAASKPSELHEHGDAFPNLLAGLAEVRAHQGLLDSSWELGLTMLLDGLQTKVDMLNASGEPSGSDPYPRLPTPAPNR
jgi:hypothetical protein